jgi:hypothetical protein
MSRMLGSKSALRAGCEGPEDEGFSRQARDSKVPSRESGKAVVLILVAKPLRLV